MGSRISRPSTDSLPISGPPHLPFDIYLEVLGHLRTSSAEDRKTLLALALCCRALRDASQRMLFSNVRCDNPASDIHKLALKTHSMFLRAVGDSPDRLALYVLSYSQRELALDPKLRSTGKAVSLDHKKDRVHLWTLTEKALSLMINLKNLYFAASVHHPSAPMILRHCTFQLESFTWVGVGSEEVLYSGFLPTQRGLLHLDINSGSSNDRRALPDGFCPSLISIACSLSDLASISAGRPIRALHVVNSTADIVQPPRADMMQAADRETYFESLGSIQYLRLWTLPQFQRFTSGFTLQVAVLELRIWQVEDTNLLAQFHSLRSLRLWDYYPAEVDSSIRLDTAHRAFVRCRQLENVLVIVNVAHSGLAWRFSPRLGGGIDEELVFVDSYVDSVWWKM